jgi:hypothetical protein
VGAAREEPVVYGVFVGVTGLSGALPAADPRMLLFEFSPGRPRAWRSVLPSAIGRQPRLPVADAKPTEDRQKSFYVLRCP